MNINLIAPINNLGYGQVGKNILRSLFDIGVNVSLFPIGGIDCEDKYKKYVDEGLQNAKRYDNFAPCIRIWHQHDMSVFVGEGPKIGFPIFELNTFSPKEKNELSKCDQLFVCSSWAKDIINRNNINISTTVVPLGVDRDIFYDTNRTANKTIFLNIGKWEVRKGHDILHKIFNLAFSKNDDVELWMMFNNPFFTTSQMNECIREYKNTELGDKIKFIPRVTTSRQVSEIMRLSTCGVFPSRAEGWNLELLEMLSCGRHCIATNYSAHTEMIDGCFGIAPDGIEPAFGRPEFDDRWFYGQGGWAKLGESFICDFAKKMRDLYKKNLTFNESGVKLAKELSWKNSAVKILEALS